VDAPTVPSGEDLQFVDRVLAEQPAWRQGADRRRLLSGLAVAGGALAALAVGRGAIAASGGDTDQAILNIADTAEHLAVTYLGYVLAKANLPADQVAILTAARYEEQIHIQTLESFGAKPLTTTFSLPGGDLTYVTDAPRALMTIEAAEGIFVGAYLAAVADFAARGNWKFAQFAAETMGVEAEHRTLVRFALAQTPANNLAFENPSVPSVQAAAQVLTQLGFLSPTAGNSYPYPGPGNPLAGAAGVGGTTPTFSSPPPGGVH
jgi:hypothetical protein